MFDFLSKRFSSILGWVKERGRLTEEQIEEAVGQVKEALLQADVPLGTVRRFLEGMREEALNAQASKKINPGQQFIKMVHDRLLTFLGNNKQSGTFSPAVPSVVMVLGLQGSGKTTTIGKLAHWMQKEAGKRGKSRKILCASVDYYRPAAREQLKVVAGQAGADYFEAQSDNPIDAAREIYAYYQKGGYQHLLFDTAGRLHVDENLLDELKQLEKIVRPQYKLLVLDTMTGQESLSVAKRFDEEIAYNGAIMSKMDSDARGGAALAFCYELNKPLFFIGVGEKITDLERFVPDRVASRILGMGDIMTLIEKTDEVVDKKEQEDITARMMSGNFSLQDFANQIGMVNKMGSLQKLARYLPGVPQVSPEMIEKGEQEMGRFKALISSMTKKERLVPQILDASRKKRVADGAGLAVSDLNQLLQKFEESKQFVKMMKKMGGLGRFFK